MCWRTRLRTVGILGVLLLSPFSLSADGPRAATVCANVADVCELELGSVCVQAGGDVSLDKAKNVP